MAGFLTLPKADVVLLGEIHDNPQHHANQAAAVGAIVPAALVFEMLTPDQAARATRDARGSAETLAQALDWDASGWPDFAMYYPIFAAAPDAKIFGAALPGDDVGRALVQGAAAIFGESAVDFGLTAPLEAADRQEREADLAAAHCGKMPARALGGMLEAQRLRDAALARAALTAHVVTGGPVVVITGSGHVRRDWGMPVPLAAAAPDLSVLSVGQLEGEPSAAPPYDLWFSSAPLARPDPCLAFQ